MSCSGSHLCQLMYNITACAQNIIRASARGTAAYVLHMCVSFCPSVSIISCEQKVSPIVTNEFTMHALFHARHSVDGCVNDVLLLFCAKCVAGAVAIYCADMMSKDVICTQKRQLSSHKSIKHKYLLVDHSKTKSSSNVSIILDNTMNSCTLEHSSFAR